jgi:signal transduction histidine kinase
VKRSQRSATPTTIPRVRALPPQRPRLVDRPGLLPAVRIAASVALVALVIFGAASVVLGVERGALPPIVIPLLSLGVLAATAAFLAGRSEGQRQQSSTADRRHAHGRLARESRAANSDANASALRRTHGTATAVEPAERVDAVAPGSVLRTKFLDDISQSLRAPITSICLAARIIRKHFDTTPEVVAHFGDTLLAEADRLGQIVDEFLELARLESGLVVWNEAEVDPADLIQRAVAEVEPVAVSYGVSVAFTMEPGLPPMQVDRDRITQLLTLLLAMSVRAASEASEIVIQIAGAHGGWVFTVGGTSFVYPHAEARKVHARCETSTPEPIGNVPENAGLSLCLCREIVGRYQGRIWIEGAPGPSGCVRFSLPYKQHRRAPAAVTAKAQASTSPGVPSPAVEASTPQVDLDLRRELAVKALQERAAIRPPSEAADAAAETGLNDTHGESVSPGSGPRADLDVPSFSESPVPAPHECDAVTAPLAQRTTEEAPTDDREGARKRKLSFARSHPSVDREHSVATPTRPVATRPVSAPSRAAASAATAGTDSDGSSGQGDSDTRAYSAHQHVGVDDEPRQEPGNEVIPEIIDDAPVRAPVTGTMITAHQRTVGPPVLAHPGVPAVSGVQSAASAAMQGSDDLLLEIAEAQSSDGHALVVSEEVRNLLATAPGTLPAVASQRAGYTPSRRRMVQAPWVVRSSPTSESDASAATADPDSVSPPAEGTQRPRLSERLAKRLGINADGGSARASGTAGGGDSRREFLRSRRMG